MTKAKTPFLMAILKINLKSICHEFWAKGTASPKCHFCTLIDILLSHYILTCNSNKHFIKILKLFIFKFKGESVKDFLVAAKASF